MSTVISIALVEQKDALAAWSDQCRLKMEGRFPEIGFESMHWPLHSKYKTDLKDWYFDDPFADFNSRDDSFKVALRCVTAEMVLAGTPRDLPYAIQGFRCLALSDAATLFDLTTSKLRVIETKLKELGKALPASAAKQAAKLSLLERLVKELETKKLIPPLGYRVRKETKSELSTQYKQHQAIAKKTRMLPLDQKVGAFSEALAALANGDPRLDAGDRVSICACAILMSAPSRINEPLCMSIDDIVSVDSYAQLPEGQSQDDHHSTHCLLLMKGSKGAEWRPKPALSFLMSMLNFAMAEVKRCGERSRRLIEWYQENPNKLYLSPELEHLRGRNLSALDLACVIHLNPQAGVKEIGSSQRIRDRLQGATKGPNPRTKTANGRANVRREILMYTWESVEELLLGDVRAAMERCRRVTDDNHYKGDLSKMLFLHDREETPFKPWAINYGYLSKRLTRSRSDEKRSRPPTVFGKLNITMPVAGTIRVANIHTHDPRRWLTTQALKHGEKLSDVIINEWANRKSLLHLFAYDGRSPEQVATASSTPYVKELHDLSQSLQKVQALEEKFGLKTVVVTVPDAQIKVTSMDEVTRAVEDRPTARTANQVIILTPTPYGVCFQQDHETPCTRDDPCLTCNGNIACKGHKPTNDAVRDQCPKLVNSVIRQLDRLTLAHNRGISDAPATLGDHIVRLFEKGLAASDLAEQLINQFEDVKDLIEDKLLRKRLEQAFVARRFIEKFDDDETPNGALIKYHNPKNHASPAFERALESHGGREQIQREFDALIQSYPSFEPKALNLRDSRDSYEASDENPAETFDNSGLLTDQSTDQEKK